MSIIGDRILERRTQLNMSQEELAVLVGYKDRSSIAKIESGERDIRQNKVIAFANALKTTPQWLMGYDGTENQSIIQTLKDHVAYLEQKNAPNDEVRSEIVEMIRQMSDSQAEKLRDFLKDTLSE